MRTDNTCFYGDIFFYGDFFYGLFSAVFSLRTLGTLGTKGTRYAHPNGDCLNIEKHEKDETKGCASRRNLSKIF